MKTYNVCILDKDIHYAKAFMKAVALEHEGFSVGMRSVCGEGCEGGTDVCLSFAAGCAAQGSCEKAFEPACGKYAGAAAILSEAKKFILDRGTGSGDGAARRAGIACNAEASDLPERALLCVHSYAGGIGTSCAAIGIGRELARYRDERVLYLSLEDVEDPGLYPPEIRAMRAEEALYRYLRLLNSDAGPEGFERLFRAGLARDEYGLYRLAPDESTGGVACLAPEELYMFLAGMVRAAGLTVLVLDFGTRLRFLKAFSAVPDRDEALFIEVRREGSEEARRAREMFSGERVINAVLPVCHEDVRHRDGHTDVGIANAFGLAVKETCDRISEIGL